MDFFHTRGEGINPKFTLLKKCGFSRGGGGLRIPLTRLQNFKFLWIGKSFSGENWKTLFSPKCVLTPKDHFERHFYFPHFFIFWRLPLEENKAMVKYCTKNYCILYCTLDINYLLSTLNAKYKIWVLKSLKEEWLWVWEVLYINHSCSGEYLLKL